MTVSLGVQLFGLSQELTEDFEGTFAQLKALGFDTVEPFFVMLKKQGKLPGNFWSYEYLDRGIAAAKKYGLQIHSLHVGISSGPAIMPVRMVAAGIRRVVEKTDIRYFVISGLFSNDGEAKRWGTIMRRLAEALADTDAVLVYHNHDGELYPIFEGGKAHCPLETFFSYAGPSVKLQLDIGWAAMAADEREVFDAFGDRFVSLHCKDFCPGVRSPKLNRDQVKPEQFAPIGTGVVRTQELVQKAVRAPGFNGDIIIDQDKCATSRMEELRIGRENLERFLGEPPAIDKGEETPKIQRDRLSLMTFTLMGDILSKKITTRDSLRLAADAGIPFVDVMNVPRRQASACRAALAETGVRVKCYIANIDFFARQETVRKQLSSCMDAAVGVNAELFMIVPYFCAHQLSAAAKMEKAEVRALLVQGFSAAVLEGRKRGLRICFETTPHAELCLSSSEDCAYVLDRVDGLEYVFDTANMLPAGEDPLQHYERMAGRISHVHLKDVLLTKGRRSAGGEFTADGWKMNCCLWGRGVIPVGAIYGRMIQDGYTGTFAVEYAHPSGLADLKTHEAQLAAHFWQ